MIGDGVPSYEELFAQQGMQGGGLGAGYPWGTGGAGWPGEQQAPPAAAPPQGMPPPPPQYQAPPPQGGGLGDALAARSNSLVGMGLGMMGGGWAGGAKGYAAGSAVDQHAMAAQMQARQHAAALAQNQEHFNRQQALREAPQLVKIKNSLGGEELFMQDPRTGKLTPYTGEGSSTGTGGLFAPGVTKVDQSLTGDDYLAQFSPEVQAATKAYIAGDTMPTGNPRANGIANVAKTIAQKWGQDTNTPVSDAIYQGKRKFILEAQSSLPNSFGGQRNSGNTALEHQEVIANKIKDLENVNLGGYLPSVAGIINGLRQQGSSDQKAKANALNDAVERYVDEVKKFYSGSASGGVAERDAARQRFSSVKTPEELYAALKTEQELMQGKLHQLQAQSDQALGVHRERQIGNIVRPTTEEAIGRTNKIMEEYRTGRTAPAASGQAGAGTSTEPARAQPGAAVVPPPAERKVNQVYSTPKGNLRWTGTGWVKP